MNKYSAEAITTEEWYRHVRKWQPGNYIDARATINPAVARAGSCGSWDIAVTLGNTTLKPGDHLAIELPVTWTVDRGRPYIYGRSTYSQWNPGYSATPKFIFPGKVIYDMAFNEEKFGRYFIVDMVILEGTLKSGSTFIIQLANPEGSLIRCQHYAQVTEIPIAVRRNGAKFYQRLKSIPQIKITGDVPRLWKVIASSGNNNNFTIRIIAADLKNLNPCLINEDPRIVPGQNVKINKPARLSGYEKAPVWIAKGKKKKDTNNISIEVLNRSAGLYGKSNPIPSGFIPGMNIYFGDLHGQSNRSIGYGTEEEYFQWAKDAELLDFVAPANHYGGREPASQKILDATYELCDYFYKPGIFATFYSYEWGGKGHRNVYYRAQRGKLFCGKDKRYSTIQSLWDNLDKQNIPALTIPHHVKFINRIDWREYNSKYQKLVEICSCWGNSEEHGDHSVQRGLIMGHRLGFVGGTDTHFSQPGRSAFGPFDFGGLTACISPALTRNNLWDSLATRHCYATTGERILLNFTINRHLMGSELPLAKKRIISVSVAGTNKIESIEIVRNNIVWKKISCDTLTFKKNFIDEQSSQPLLLSPQVGQDNSKFMFYYVRVTQQDGHQAFSSPIWFIESHAAGDVDYGHKKAFDKRKTCYE